MIFTTHHNPMLEGESIMPVIICPTCSTRYRIDDAQLSKARKLKCKKCGNIFPIKEHQEHSVFPEKTDTSARPVSAKATSPQSPQQDVNLGELALDFGMPQNQGTAGLNFSFDVPVPEEKQVPQTTDDDEEEALSSILHSNSERSGAIFEELSFAETGGAPQKNSSEDDRLDFSSFSADIPESTGEDDGEQEESSEEMGAEEPESDREQDVAIDSDALNELTLPSLELQGKKPAAPQKKAPPAAEKPKEHVAETAGKDAKPEPSEPQEELPLSTCCIDSLAMGLKKCEICGRNLAGKDVGQSKELYQQRKQQLKSELLQTESKIGFSEETAETEIHVSAKISEDFSDVERALDALADGSFQVALKKKAHTKHLAKTVKIAGIGITAALVLIGVILWSLLPSAHEKLLSRYEQLAAQPEMDPRAIAKLFLDAAIAQDQEVIAGISVIKGVPDITAGDILGVGEAYDDTSIGSPGTMHAKLLEEIDTLGKTIDEKTKLLNQYSSKNVSSKLITQSLDTLKQKYSTLQTEFEDKKAESEKKSISLRQNFANIQQEIVDNEQMYHKYMDATDKIGKALYQKSVANRQLLADKKGKIEIQIAEEAKKYQQQVQKVKQEYDPQFAEFEKRIQEEKVRLDEAKLLEDDQKSPVTVLSKDLELLTKTIVEKKSAVEETERQLKDAVEFFKRDQVKSQVMNAQNSAEFAHVSKNVSAAIKIGGSSKQQISIVLKRYRAIIGDQTLQSDWIVEKLAQ